MFKCEKVNQFLKISLIMISLGLITPDAFCGGTVTGTIDTNLIKYKGEAVVYLKDVKGPVVPQRASIQMRNLTFTPKITVLPLGSTIDFTSYDQIYHNIFSISPAKKFRIDSMDTGISKSVTFDSSGVVQLLCSCHPDMIGWVFIGKNQYAVQTEHDGKFSISNVPVGTYEVVVWSKRLKLGNKTMVTVKEGETSALVLKMND
jgi:plastocyanin